MHDLKKLMDDAHYVGRHGNTEQELRLAAFVRDYLDETPVDEEWIASLSVSGRSAFMLESDGVWYTEGDSHAAQILCLGIATRGRVRAFAIGMGLTLREGE